MNWVQFFYKGPKYYNFLGGGGQVKKHPVLNLTKLNTETNSFIPIQQN